MSNVAYMDSSGFGILLSAIQVLRPRNGALVLACCNETITRMLTITRLNMVFPVYATRPEAISDIEHREAVHEPA
jgi:anti-sigma B factor antagonist